MVCRMDLFGGVVMAAQHAEAPDLLVDRMSTVLNAHDPDRALGQDNATAGLWRSRLRTHHPWWPKVEKTKAHRARITAIREGDELAWLLNDHADRLADTAAEHHRYHADVEQQYLTRLPAAERLLHLGIDILSTWQAPTLPVTKRKAPAPKLKEREPLPHRWI